MKIKRQIVLLAMLAIILVGLLPTYCQAETIIDRMRGSPGASELPGGYGDDTDTKVQEIVGNIIQIFLSVFGVIFMGLMIFGGYKWMMASGREEEVKKAKDTIKAAIVGLVIVMAAYAISYFVALGLQQATGPAAETPAATTPPAA